MNVSYMSRPSFVISLSKITISLVDSSYNDAMGLHIMLVNHSIFCLGAYSENTHLYFVCNL